MNPTARLKWQSPIGLLAGEVSARGMRGLRLEGATGTGDFRRMALAADSDADCINLRQIFSHIEIAERFLSQFLDGCNPGYCPELDLVGQNDFNQAVWLACRELGWGQTVSYGELAQRAGRPGAARAVGGSMARNPILLMIPCHRVVGSDGRLTGFACGLETKRRLLEREKPAVSASL